MEFGQCEGFFIVQSELSYDIKCDLDSVFNETIVQVQSGN